MAIVRSFGGLQSLGPATPAWASWNVGGGALGLYGLTQSYATIYKTQPNVRTVIDFLARNIAQLGIHVFRRLSDTDRERLADHQIARWLSRPNPATTRYRLIESLMQDLGIYYDAYWLKVRTDTLGLVRLPPEQMSIEGTLQPTAFVWTNIDGSRKSFAPSEIVHFSGYNPSNPLMGLSGLETLRRILAEEQAAGTYREAFWNNAGRIEGVISRPKDAPRWSPEQQVQFREQWQAAHAGGMNSGKTAILVDGMTWTATAFSARDSEFLAARKLTREECAAAFHIPLPMVGILEHATFSNIREQHKHLYQDCLGPWLVMIEEEIERQLLIEADDQANVYVEFNIAEKLKGSFEEQATSLQALVGRPIMTANEGRARLNLPSKSDDPTADELAAQQGGPSGAAAPADQAGAQTATEVVRVIHATQIRQAARLAKIPADDRVATFDHARWTRELAADLTPLLGAEAALARATKVNDDVLTGLLNEATYA